MAFLLVLFAFQTLSAQDRFSVELRGGASFATEKLGDTDLAIGFGFEGILAYRFMSHLGVYAGWGWNKFASDNSFAGTEVDFEETGYMFGFQFSHPIGKSPVAYYVRGGGIYNHIEVENNNGDIIADSEHGIGWQLGAGVDISLGSNWHLIPGVKYQALSRDIKLETTTTAVDLNYISASIGIAKKF